MSIEIPEGLLCTKSHEYIYQDGDLYVVGISDHAVEQLGDIVFVELPEVDSEFEKGEVFGTIESVKAASEVYSPLSGKVIEVNEEILNNPEFVNEDCYSKGWLVKVEASDPDELNTAMDYDTYIADLEG